MLLCLFVFLWKIIRNMSTISATIQQEHQLELLKQQLLEHQRRKLRHLQKLHQRQVQQQVSSTKQTHYQKLRKVCRDKTGAKENFLLHKFLFGGAGGEETIPEDRVVDAGGGEENGAGEALIFPLDGDNGSGFGDKDAKFLRMSEHPNRQPGKFVLSQQNQYLLNHPPPPLAAAAAAVGVVHHPQRRYLQQSQSQQSSPIRRPLASNANFWSNRNNNGNAPAPTPTATTAAAAAGSFHCYYPCGVGGGTTIPDGAVAPGDDLREDTLKTNVQIVLDNINRNYHALREQILNNNHQQLHNNKNNNSNASINNNNNNNNQANLILLQRLQSVSQQLKKQQLAGTLAGSKMAAASPDSDTNCNPYMPPLSCSIASSQDFSHDYSDYQWFMDYGYRDGITHQSILSALSASYNGIGELSYYEDLAKNIDANLAEVDMESFRTEDIHSLLTTLPATSSAELQQRRSNRNNNRGETGGVPGLELNLAGSTCGLDNSICKSELLFSPVKESHISVDSLDMDGYPDEDDIILTCQANKNNYTIAFEQSALYSDESFYDGPENYGKYKQMHLHNNLDLIIRKKAQETAMSLSEVGYTTWSKLRKNGPAQRLPLVSANPLINQISRHAPTCFVRKSLSMPDLKEKCESLTAESEPQNTGRSNQLNVSQAANSSVTSGESYGKQMRTLLPMYPVPTDFAGESPAPLRDSSMDNNEDQAQNQPSFNLVKLFIKQKSSSTDTCMDVSSGCWPSDSTNSASGGENNNNSNTNLAVINSKDRSRKKSMNDSGKCSTLGRHDEEEFQFDSLDAQINNNNNNNGSDGTTEDKQERQAKLNDFNSPLHKRNYKAYNLNIANKNLPAINPVVYNLMNNNNSGSGQGAVGGGTANLSSSSITNNNNHNNNNSFKDTNSDASRTSENLTQIFNNAGSGGNGAKTRVPIEMITKSMQTSFIGTKEKVRVIPPSFLDRLNKLGDKQKAPVFVVYPNYVLPDLGFLNTQNDVVISPLSFKENFGHQRSQQPHMRKPRPVSMNDIENIKAKEYKHVLDWKSLITLLPLEYRKLLRNVPEANEAQDGAPQKPLFCMTPPLRRGRGVTCDCVNILNTQTYNSSSSGGSSSQPPSSGYRGSSTMLTDSEMDLLGPNGSGGFSNNLYVYQYDSPAEVTSAERPPSGRVAPKGILRRTPVQRPTTKAKRNSMFEDQKVPSVAEKRRSLQEPCYNFSADENLILEDSINELQDVGIRKVNNSPNMSQHHPGARLPNTPKLPTADDYHRLNKLNELNDFELGKAVSSKLNRAQQHQSIEDDLEARSRAEHFLSNVPKSELKHYAEIAHILETTTAEGATAPSEEMYDRTRLRHEVSRALSQRKNVSFNQTPAATNTTPVRQQQAKLLRPTEIKFSTPPNSPNMSVTAVNQKPPQKPALNSPSAVNAGAVAAERERQDKIQSNRFKRLQIQWELLSKEGQQLKQELQQQPRSGGNTPTGALKSRIPRPVSYPTTRANSDPMVSKTLKSPSRIVPPKKYSVGSALNVVMAGGGPIGGQQPQPAPRTPSKVLHTTPKKSAGGPRPATRTRIPPGAPGKLATPVGAATPKPTTVPKKSATIASAVASGPKKIVPTRTAKLGTTKT